MKRFCLILFMAMSAAAQSTNASLSGTVLDPARARVVGVQLSAQNIQTGIVLTGVTNEAGVYVFPSVQPGRYKLTADAPGFRNYVLNDIVVDVSARMIINITLELPTTQASVEVTAAPDALAASTASVAGVITGRQLLELPLPDRDSLDLIKTQAGTLGDNFSGTRMGALNITRDGINVMDQYINAGLSSMIVNSVDDIEEVRVVTSPVDAEFGRGFGQVQMLTRSGTNEFHGSLYEYHRNTVLDANSFFNNLRGDPRDALIQNSFGGRLGNRGTHHQGQGLFLLQLAIAASGAEPDADAHRIDAKHEAGHFPVLSRCRKRECERGRADSGPERESRASDNGNGTPAIHQCLRP